MSQLIRPPLWIGQVIFLFALGALWQALANYGFINPILIGDPVGILLFLYNGQEIDKPLSNMAMLALLKRMNRSDLTVHGFRSTFRDWAAETTEYPNELVEMALAHTIKNKAEAAYRRGNLLDRRRALMQAWANFCMEISADASP